MEQQAQQRAVGGAGAAVLRVKRKRDGSGVPAEALLLSCKRLRADSAGVVAASCAAEGDGVEENLFKLVATVASEDEPVQKYVQEAISKNTAAQLLRPSLGSTQRVIQDLRSSKHAKRQESRYRLIASHRPTFTDGEAPVLGAHEEAGTGGGTLASGAQEDASPGEAHNASDHRKEFQLFDIIQEEEEEEEEEADSPATELQNQNDPDVILCNAVEMIRQRLTVSDRTKDRQCDSKEGDDYVFDIYYMETASSGWIEDILSVQPYTQDCELVDEDRIAEETYDDEDDENSENNWRNDYPDEEDFLPGEDGEESESESNSDEDSGCIRTRWEKYQSDVLQEFEYDGLQELDSD